MTSDVWYFIKRFDKRQRWIHKLASVNMTLGLCQEIITELGMDPELFSVTIWPDRRTMQRFLRLDEDVSACVGIASKTLSGSRLDTWLRAGMPLFDIHLVRGMSFLIFLHELAHVRHWIKTHSDEVDDHGVGFRRAYCDLVWEVFSRE